MNNTFYDIDGVRIPFNNNWNSVAISVSGGADSALLAYLICNLAKDTNVTIHIINHVRMWKTRPWQQEDAENVYNWLFQEFHYAKFVRHINFIAPELEYGNIGPTLTDEYGKAVSGDNIQQRAYAEFICHKHNIDAYFNAVTCNPKFVEFKGMSERNVKPSEDNKHLEFMIHMDRIASHPFRFVDKSWVLKQYKRLRIEELFNRTRSCEGEFENITYKTYTPGQYVPTCGTCFWCKEREWAIEQNK
jgi:7-cyano-7-deazaguanine synthase in queuosine biosynthesis